jgi:hypothetical protein
MREPLRSTAVVCGAANPSPCAIRRLSAFPIPVDFAIGIENESAHPIDCDGDSDPQNNSLQESNSIDRNV